MFAGRRLPGLLLGLTLVPAPAAQIGDLRVERDADGYRLELRADLAAPIGAVWATLTDYPNLHHLSAAVRKVEVGDEDADGAVPVRTLSHVCVFIFCKDLDHLQLIREAGPGRLEADSLPERSDFRSGFTRWQLAGQGQATRLELRSELRPAFWVPPLLGPLLIQEGLRATVLDAVRGLEREALRLTP